MKITTTSLVVLLFITTLFSSFNGNAQDSLNSNNSEFELLVQHLESNGNFINSELAPALISADEIKENLKNDKYLVLDIRSESWFDYGHIKNSKNVKGPELLNYFKNEIDPANFEKITILCYSGQSAAYYTSLLRLYGYSNVYNLKWGMSSWAEEFATNVWVKNSKNTYVANLETTPNAKPEIGIAPLLNTGKTDVKEILKDRITQAFTKPYNKSLVKTDSIFKNPEDFYIVHYANEENYNFGHIKGAVRYQPQSSLTSTESLYTLPANKKVLVNCMTGQTSAYVVAYLRILGYDASNLSYGSNGYMNTTLVEKDWNGFSTSEIKNHPIVE